MERLLFTPTFILYIAGILVSVVATARRAEKLHAAAAGLLALGGAAHLAGLVVRGVASGRAPLSNLGEFLLSLSCLVLFLHLVVWLRWKVHAAGLVLPPLVAAFLALGLKMAPAPAAALGSQSRGLFVVHTSFSTVGLAALGVAFAMSLIFLVQDHALKAKWSFGALQRLPSLDTCDTIGQLAVLWGFPLLTLGIVTGVLWNWVEHHRVWTPQAKQTFPLLTWLLFASLLFLRERGYRGRRSAYLTILGFALGLLTAVGMTR